MLILTIDTCDARGSVALVEFAGQPTNGADEGMGRADGSVLASEAHLTSEDYSTWLLPAVERVLRVAGKRLAEVKVIAAAAGPGSFTGIRIALTTAKAWNETLGIPIAAVSRLEALASHFSSLEAIGPASGVQFVAASCDAQRGQLYAAIYRREQADAVGGTPGRVVRWGRLGDERVVSPGELIGWAGETAGDGSIGWAALEPASLTSNAAWQQRAGRGEEVQQVPALLAPAIARVASRLAAEGKLTEALVLDANYIRRPDAEVKWKGYAKPLPTQSKEPKAAPGYGIRAFASADAAAVARIAAGAPEAAQWPESSYADMLGKGYAAWVAIGHEAGTITGFVITRAVAPDAELLNLAVTPGARRKGVATALLQIAMEALERQGIGRLWLEVRSTNAAAISFYKKHLFRVTGTRPRYYREPDDDALLMEMIFTATPKS